MSIEDCVDASTQRPELYIKNSKERLITAANNSNGNKKSHRKTIKAKMGNRTTLWIVQVINWQKCAFEDTNMAKKEKRRQKSWIFVNSNIKQCCKE